MSESSLRKSAGVAVLMFVPLLIASIVVMLPAPMSDKSTAKIVHWYTVHRELAFTSGALTVLATLTFLWFIGYLHHSLTSRASTASGLAPILTLSSVYTIAVATISALPPAAIAVAVNRPNPPANASLVHTLGDLTTLSISLIGVGLAVFLAAIGGLLSAGALRPRWASWVAYVGAVLALVGGVAGFFPSITGKANPLSYLGLIGTVPFVIVLVAVGIDILRRPDSAPASVRNEVPAEAAHA